MTDALSLGFTRTVLELKMYFRERESVFFSFAFPILMLGLFSLIFSGTLGGGPGGPTPVEAPSYFLPAMASAGVLLTSFQTMALQVATERDDGTLKRIHGTPLPPLSYFLGKVGLVLVSSLAQLLLLMLIARLAFGAELPDTAAKWLTLAWVFVLGVAGGTVLGLAYSSLASSARSAGAVVIGPLLILQFISGVYTPFDNLPQWLQQVASVFPLKWIGQGLRSVFLPEDWAMVEMNASWEHGRTALVLIAWFVVGVLLCVRTFRWQKRGSV